MNVHIPKGTPIQVAISRPGELQAVFDWTKEGLDWPEIVQRLKARRQGAQAARLDADKQAQPQTRLIAKVDPFRRFNGQATHFEGPEGERTRIA